MTAIPSTPRPYSWSMTCCGVLIVLNLADVQAGQGIATDGSLGAAQTLSGTSVTIPQGLGKTFGTNLFHSFAQFNINPDQTVTFTENIPNSLDNVISRVTGGSDSQINGLLRSTPGGHADFYLINPAGVVFGANAQIDVPGAFHVSTADSLKFKDGASFNATHPETSTLTSAAPAAFGFLGTSVANNGLLKVDGAQLSTQTGKTFDAVAGQIQIENGANINAPGGEIRLVAKQGAGDVGLERPAAGNLPLPTDTPSAANAGTITVTDSKVLSSGDGGGRIGVWGGDVTVTGSQSSSQVRAANTGVHNAGAVDGLEVAAKSLTVDHGSTVNSAATNTGNAGQISVTVSGDMALVYGAIGAPTAGQGNGGNVKVMVGGNLTINGQGRGTGITSAVAPGGSGNAGNVEVMVKRNIAVANGGLIDSSTLAKGKGGSVRVVANGNLTVDGQGTAAGISSVAGAAGDAGSVNITTKGDAAVVNGGQISSSTGGHGNAGSVTIAVGHNLTVNGQGKGAGIVSTAEKGSSGDAGTVEITTQGDMTVLNGAGIASNTYAQGKAGSVKADIGGNLTIDGKEFPTGIFSNAEAGSSGDAGTVAVTVKGNVAMTNSKSFIDSSTFGPGRAGVLSVRTQGNLALLNGAEIGSTTFDKGNGGDVKVDVGGNLTIDGQGYTQFLTGISADAAKGSSGDAGSVTVTTKGNMAVLNGGEVASATKGLGKGGEVTVDVGGNLRIDKQGSGKFTGIGSDAASESSGGDAGNVAIMVKGNAAVLHGAEIGSNTFAKGNGGSVKVDVGGNLTIDSQGYTQFLTGISSDAALGSTGDGGNIAVMVKGNLTLLDKSAKIAADTFGPGSGGNVKVDVGGTLRIDSQGNTPATTGIVAQAFDNNSGAAGTVSVATKGDVTMTGPGSVISSDTHGPRQAGVLTVTTQGNMALLNGAGITSITFAQGKAGNVKIDVGGNLTIDGQGFRQFATGIFSSAERGSSSDAGTVVVTTRGDAALLDGAVVSSANIGTGKAGDVNIAIGHNLTLGAQGFRPWFTGIVTAANRGDGGNIQVRTGEMLFLRDSQIKTSVSGSGGNGGDITVQSKHLVMETGLIQANAVSGRGGDISLDVQTFVASGNTLNGRQLGVSDPFDTQGQRVAWHQSEFGSNVIQAVSETGVSGTITLTAPQLNLSGTLSNLGNPAFDTGAIQEDYCTLGTGSSLTVEGKGGLPLRSRDLILY